MGAITNALAQRQRDKGAAASDAANLWTWYFAQQGLKKGQKDYEASMAPYTGIGKDQIGVLNSLFGTDSAAASRKLLESDPGYQARMDAMTKGAERGAMARGNLFSGNFAEELARKQGQFGSDEFSNAFNRLFGLVDYGRGVNEGIGKSKYNTAASIANMLRGAGAGLMDNARYRGESRANTIRQEHDDVANAFGTVMGMFGGGGGKKKSGGGATPSSDTYRGYDYGSGSMYDY